MSGSTYSQCFIGLWFFKCRGAVTSRYERHRQNTRLHLPTKAQHRNPRGSLISIRICQDGQFTNDVCVFQSRCHPKSLVRGRRGSIGGPALYPGEIYPVLSRTQGKRLPIRSKQGRGTHHKPTSVLIHVEFVARQRYQFPPLKFGRQWDEMYQKVVVNFHKASIEVVL